MMLTRRALLSNAGKGDNNPISTAVIAARGREAMIAEGNASLISPAIPSVDPDEIRSNENPLGPGQAALKSLRGEYDQMNRYPMNARISEEIFLEDLAKMHSVKTDNIVLGPGSAEILRNSVRAFTGPEKPLVTAECSYENPVATSEQLGNPVRAVPNTPALGLDLDKMAGAAMNSGLVFLCNPNNPTGTVHGYHDISTFVRWVTKESPYTTILIDEAYHEYVTDPTYQTSINIALKYPNVFVSRTFSKAFGMAGIRVGYAIGHKETIARLRSFRLTLGNNILGIAAAVGALKDSAHINREIARNTLVKQFTLDFFRRAGYWTTNSQTNFIFVKLGIPAKKFREACAQHKVLVGRDFPPYERTHCRISIGTMDEMKHATRVFSEVLGLSVTDTGASN